jgi:hypothetical protein
MNGAIVAVTYRKEEEKPATTFQLAGRRFVKLEGWKAHSLARILDGTTIRTLR